VGWKEFLKVTHWICRLLLS